MSRSRIILLVALVSGALLLAGCGGNDDTGGDEAATTGSTEVATSESGMSGGGGAGSLTAEGFAFQPSELSFPSGGTVTFTFTNRDSAPHTFTLDDVEGVDQEVAGGESAEISFPAPEPGTYGFHCELHPSMTGTLTIT